MSITLCLFVFVALEKFDTSDKNHAHKTHTNIKAITRVVRDVSLLSLCLNYLHIFQFVNLRSCYNNTGAHAGTIHLYVPHQDYIYKRIFKEHVVCVALSLFIDKKKSMHIYMCYVHDKTTKECF